MQIYIHARTTYHLALHVPGPLMYTPYMRAQLKNERGNLFPPPLGFEPWSPQPESQCAAN